MKFEYKIILFLILNFGALAIGSWLMRAAVMGDWYQSLNKAPWTPPGWVFGAAWTTIMICFSVYMSHLTESPVAKNVALLFGIQWVFNTAWNYIFFAQHWVLFGFIESFYYTCAVIETDAGNAEEQPE